MANPHSIPNDHAMELSIGHYPQIKHMAMGLYAHDRPVLCAATEATAEQGARVVEALALQLVAKAPPGGSQVALFEPRATQRLAELKYLLAATQGELGRQWVTPREAVAELQALHELTIKRAALLAAARQPSLAAYNAGRRAPDPVHVVLLCGLGELVLQDPAALRTVQHLAEQGPRCGVVLLVLHELEATRDVPLQPGQRKALYEMLGALAPRAFGFDFSDAAKPMPYNMGEPYQRFIADFGYAPEFGPDELRGYAEAVLAAREAKAAENPHQDFLRVKVGEARALPAYFALGHASYAFNAMVSGGSGSGKTTFVQNLILSIGEQYTPEQIELTLVDYGTVSFGPYRNVAHVQTVFDTPRDGERLARLLGWFVDELNRRKEAFKACGEAHDLTVDNLATYQRLTGQALPIGLLVMDEFGSLMGNDNTAMATVNGRAVRVSAHAEQVLNLLAREGRKVGLHVVLITQSFAKVDRMPQDLKSNPRLAVGLKAEEARDSHALLNSENDAAYRIEPFQAVFNWRAGQVKDNVVVDLDYVSEDAIAQRQAALRRRWPRTGPSPLAMFLDAQAGPDDNVVDKEERGPARDGADWLRKPRA